MKPLELTVYPKDPSYEPSDAFTVYLMPDGGKECAGTQCAIPSRKRLMDAELAADYHEWAAHMNKMKWAETVLMQQDEPEWSEEIWDWLGDRAETLYRFATLPHYDEEVAA